MCLRRSHRLPFLGGGRCEALRPAASWSLCSSKTDKAGKESSVPVKRVTAPVKGELRTRKVRQEAVYARGKRNRRGKSVQAV